jgi:hypothetical protein
MDLSRHYLIETSINSDGIRIRYADKRDAEEAKAWVDIQSPFGHMQINGCRIEEPEMQYLSALQLAALRVARELISDEIKRLVGAGGRA